MIENHLLTKTDGFLDSSGGDSDDWIADDDLRRKACRSLHEIVVLLNIIV